MKLTEGLSYKDLEGLIKPSVHVDEFSSKMGEDSEIVVISFYLRNKQAADDLVNWFEKGYDFVLDADQSPGEVRSNRYLVYVEMKRRSYTGENIHELLSDLTTLCEYNPEDWTLVYEGKESKWSEDQYNAIVPGSPREYREKFDTAINEMRLASGITPKKIYETDSLLKQFQNAAGINPNTKK